MAQEAVQFRQGIAAGVAAVAKDTDLDPELAKYAKALNLILNAQDKSEAAQKEAVGQAAYLLLGNDAQKVEALMLDRQPFSRLKIRQSMFSAPKSRSIIFREP